MNVFVLCTGRCGSTTFIEACKHIENFSAGHESRAQLLGEERFNYPTWHIEADNRLSWFLWGLDKRYGDDAIYIHLIRDRDATAESFNQRWFLKDSIIRFYKSGILMKEGAPLNNAQDAIAYCYDYYDKVNEAIENFLKNKSKKLTIKTESLEVDFPVFWKMVGAKGNINKALSTLVIKYNAKEETVQDIFKLNCFQRGKIFFRFLKKIFKQH
ncbi:hypothetical protein [Lewinella cohaerens]|uniref:hypothetical protein n=1 Tax=Lewinella cohaerens TaxID=70995 RepID=UPI00037E4536|nr:hypothetical protein [Lewinella cohaerens]